MPDESDNLVPTMLRTIRQTQLEQGLWLTAIEIGINRICRDVAGDPEAAAITASRLDAISERLDRLERRDQPG